MDLAILKKKISTYKTTTGKLTRVPDELAYEILKSWEQWTGTASSFYSEIDVKAAKMASVIGRAKKLQREGFFPADDFKEIKIDSAFGQVLELTPCSGVEVVWDNGKIIRFSQVDLLLDFLKKAA
jgi:hypothetical protein